MPDVIENVIQKQASQDFEHQLTDGRCVQGQRLLCGECREYMLVIWWIGRDVIVLELLKRKKHY